MSALPPKADIAERNRHVRLVPKADIKSATVFGREQVQQSGVLGPRQFVCNDAPTNTNRLGSL